MLLRICACALNVRVRVPRRKRGYFVGGGPHEGPFTEEGFVDSKNFFHEDVTCSGPVRTASLHIRSGQYAPSHSGVVLRTNPEH